LVNGTADFGFGWNFGLGPARFGGFCDPLATRAPLLVAGGRDSVGFDFRYLLIRCRFIELELSVGDN